MRDGDDGGKSEREKDERPGPAVRPGRVERMQHDLEDASSRSAERLGHELERKCADIGGHWQRRDVTERQQRPDGPHDENGTHSSPGW